MHNHKARHKIYNLEHMAAPEKFLHSPTPHEMPPSADVVVIGGGMAGTAAAWALDAASPGIHTIVLEQSGHLAAGASTASIENFRSVWPTACLAEMMRGSIDVFLHADEYLGEGANKALNVRQRGYLYCAFTEKDARDLQSDVESLKSAGLPHVEFLDTDDIQARYPWLNGDCPVVAAKFDPLAGWLDSNALAYQYAKAARGAQFILGIEESRIVVEGNKVVGVNTEHGYISTPNVIIAAGAGSREVGRSAGIEIPIVVRPRNSFTTGYSHLPPDAPFIIGSTPHPYVRPTGERGAIFGWEYHWTTRQLNGQGQNNPVQDHLVTPIFPTTLVQDPRHPGATLELLSRQFHDKNGKGFSNPGYLARVHQSTGYYVYRSDEAAYATLPDGTRKPYNSERAIIEAWPEISGLYLSVAHVGHGVMASAEAGRIIAAYVVGQEQRSPLYQHFKLSVPFVPNDGGGL